MCVVVALGILFLLAVIGSGGSAHAARAKTSIASSSTQADSSTQAALASASHPEQLTAAPQAARGPVPPPPPPPPPPPHPPPPPPVCVCVVCGPVTPCPARRGPRGTRRLAGALRRQPAGRRPWIPMSSIGNHPHGAREARHRCGTRSRRATPCRPSPPLSGCGAAGKRYMLLPTWACWPRPGPDPSGNAADRALPHGREVARTHRDGPQWSPGTVVTG